MTSFWTRLSSPEPAPPWGLLPPLVALVLAFVFLTLVGGAVAVSLLPTQPLGLLVGWLVGSLLTVLFIAFTRRTPEARAALRLGSSTVPLLIVFALGFGFAVTLDLAAAAFVGEVVAAPELAVVTGGLAAWLLGALLVLLAQPVMEELVFRGLLYPALRAAQGFAVALGVSALFYGLFHQLIYTAPVYQGPVGLWYTFAEPLLAGVMLGGVRAYAKSTRAAIAAHVGFGVFALLKSLFIAGAFNA